MKTSPKVLKDMMEAIKQEQTLHNKYQLSKRQFKYWGLSGACKLGKLQHECHEFVNMLTRHLLFRGESKFDYQPESVGLEASPDVILTNLLNLNHKIVELYENAIETAVTAKDSSSAKLFSHLSKWHQFNYKDGNGDGHIDWLEKQLDSINRVGGMKEWWATKI